MVGSYTCVYIYICMCVYMYIYMYMYVYVYFVLCLKKFKLTDSAAKSLLQTLGECRSSDHAHMPYGMEASPKLKALLKPLLQGSLFQDYQRQYQNCFYFKQYVNRL